MQRAFFAIVMALPAPRLEHRMPTQLLRVQLV
jgi:hypothetical protein